MRVRRRAPAAVLMAAAPAEPAHDLAGPILDAKALQQLLSRQALPALEVLPVTETSHPFNGAAWQNVPIDLAGYRYVETEYLISGTANVYDWVAGSDFDTRVLRSGPYATRLLVRRPADMSTWSGRVVVEMINSTELYDWTAIWSALWEQLLAKHDVYVGITAKPACSPACSGSTRGATPASRWPTRCRPTSRPAAPCRATRTTTPTSPGCTRTGSSGTSSRRPGAC